MNQFRLVLNESGRQRSFYPKTEDSAYRCYEVLKTRVCNPNSKFFGAGIQLYDNELCIREFPGHDTSCGATAR